MKHTSLRLLVFILICISTVVEAQHVSVLTQRYSNKRLSWNDKEPTLDVTNVNSHDFGMLFRRDVDDQLYAQPLIVSDMQINGGTHNVVFLATVNNSIYAFDADDSASSTPFWQVNLSPPGCRSINRADMTGACGGNYYDFSGNMGIVGTPVIDTTTGTLYVVSRDYKLSSGEFEQYLHAMDIFTGAEKPGSPVYITAKCMGAGDGSVNDTITFHQQRQNQRSALMLFNGVVYICWAAHCDWDPYHGWMVGYDATTLQQKYVYNDTPDGHEGGIWMSGTGPTVDDSGYIYIATGNGTVGRSGNPNYFRDRGESLVKMIPSGDSMLIVDFFTPSNYQYLEANDLDYGVDGVLIIPQTTLSLSGSKEGRLYLVDNTHMGHYTAGNDSVIQILNVNNQTIVEKHIHGTPVYFKYNDGTDKECVYVWSESDSLRQLFFNRASGMFDTTQTIVGNIRLDNGMPGAMLSVSSNGSNQGTGIVWASHPTSGNANQQLRPGRLDAYDAANITHQLWNSDMVPNRDSVGTFAKFNTPVVANGKVYCATFSNQLNVYGHLPNVIGTNDFSKPEFFVSVFPNPARQEINISYSGLNSSGRFSITLTDVFGRTVDRNELEFLPGSHHEKYDLPADLSAGIYHLTFVSGEKIVRVVKLAIY